MRFCMVTTFYPPCSFGGDAISVQQLSRALVRRGHEVTVVHDVDAFAALDAGPLPPYRRGRRQGVRVVRLKSRWGALSPLLVHQLGRPVLHGSGSVSSSRRRLRRGDFPQSVPDRRPRHPHLAPERSRCTWHRSTG